MKTLLKLYGNVEKETHLLQGIVEVEGVAPGSSQKEIDKKLESCDILLGDIEIKVDRKLLSKTRKLTAVICRSIGVDFVDVPAATERGILVLNSPDFCVSAVAEYTIGMMFALIRRIPQGFNAVAKGNWDARSRLRGMEIEGRTLGVVGFGRIGRNVASIAQSLGMNILAYDPYPPTKRLPDVTITGLNDLLHQADIVTIHTPLTNNTRGMIGRQEFNLMKDGAYLINVARGGIAEEEAILSALKSGKLAGAALDVLTEEPPCENHALVSATKNLNLIITPHIAWNTAEASRRNGKVFLEQISALAADKIPPHVINPAAIPELERKLHSTGYINE